jgi:hypothetical protein
MTSGIDIIGKFIGIGRINPFPGKRSIVGDFIGLEKEINGIVTKIIKNKTFFILKKINKLERKSEFLDEI